MKLLVEKLILILAIFSISAGAIAATAARGLVLYSQPPADTVNALEFVTVTKSNVSFSLVLLPTGERVEIPRGGIVAFINYPPETPTVSEAEVAIRNLEAAIPKYPLCTTRLRTALTKWNNALAFSRQLSRNPVATPAKAASVPALIINGIKYADATLSSFDGTSVGIVHTNGVAKIAPKQLTPPQITALNATSTTVRIDLNRTASSPLPVVPIATVGVQASPPQYSVNDLGANGATSSRGIGINASGHVVGSSAFHVVRWTGTTPTDLGTFNGQESYGFVINASGQVAGSSRVAGGSTLHAVRWTGTTPTDLGTLGGSSSWGWGINDSGQVVGNSDTADRRSNHAVRWTDTTPTDLGTLGGMVSVGHAINASGQVAGMSEINGGRHRVLVEDAGPDQTKRGRAPSSVLYPSGSARRAVRWTGTTPTDLGTLGGSESEGYGINVSGQVVGMSYLPGDRTFHAVRWTGTTPTDLGTLGGSFSQASAINGAGDITGWSYTAGDEEKVPFLYTGGKMYDLRILLLPGSGVTDLYLDEHGSSINDLGQIAATGTIGGQTQAVLLTPSRKERTADLQAQFEGKAARPTTAPNAVPQFTIAEEALRKLFLEYKTKAEHGDATAQLSLGICYQRGEGVEKDYAEAVNWYRKAAEQNDAKAQSRLGLCYNSGEGVQKDVTEGYAWLNLASKTLEGAAYFRDLWEKAMSPKQVGDAQKRTKELRSQIDAKLKNAGK